MQLCEVLKVCEHCCKVTNRNRGKHECGMNWCTVCRKKHSVNELCYMQPIEGSTKEENKKFLYIFYDFETRQDEAYKEHPTTRIHVPNLCVAQQVCTDCLDSDDVSQWCNTCGVREYVFRDHPVKQLIEHCVREKSVFYEIICIAHNAGGFDAQFILKELAESSEQDVPSIILKGQNIISMRYGRTKFIDSLNFFHMKLSALPATFGLPEDTQKKFFPHLFNTIENQTYVGSLPPKLFYAPERMNAREREEFLVWYEGTPSDYVFDFKKEIVVYCRMDVEILRRACLAFRKIFLEVGDTDPLVSSLTIAAACSRVFRKKFLTPNTIGIIPPGGYRRSDKHSQVAVEWLLVCEREIEREIIHAARSREYLLPEGFLVDGYLPGEGGAKGTVFEFQGCFVHGCTKCFRNSREKTMPFGRSFTDAYESTRAKIHRIKSLGYTVVEMWECEWKRIKSEDPRIEEYLSDHPLINKITLNPRDALCGGRTENTVTSFTAAPGQKILYYDKCSMYPHQCKTGYFPIGHPRIYVGKQCDELTDGDNDNMSRVEGLVKCRVLPPRDLFLPVLPVKMNGRLLFPLCRSCCEEERQDECNHEEIDDRTFTGTFVVNELRKAIEKGYRVMEIFVIWQYRVTRYDKTTGEGGLFASYVNTFLKLKQEASGWPDWCVDEESKSRYIKEYEENEGIRLDPEKIQKNPGLRTVAKLCLNSFWGKFAEREDRKHTEIVKTRESLLDLLSAPEKEVLAVLPATDEVLYVNWRYRKEAIVSAPHTNVVIAAYTTAQARLQLYEVLEKLDRRTLYCDTDSVVFVKNNIVKDEYEPPLGNLLGAWTDELSCFGAGTYIQSFLAAAPKFYCFRAITPADEVVEKCKIKGVSLNHRNSLKINFESIRNLIECTFDDESEDQESNYIRVNFRAIRRMPNHEIVTRDESKTCKVVLRKRHFVSQQLSLPFGYKS